jgi:hypothetical protein
MDRFLLPTTSVCAVIIAGSDEQIEQTGSMQYRRDCVATSFPPRLQARLRGHRVEAEAFRLPFRALARLAQNEEPGSARRVRGRDNLSYRAGSPT